MYLLAPIYLAQLGVMGWSIPLGVPAALPPGWVGYVPSKEAGTGNRLSGIYITALTFDTSVFLLTLGWSVYLKLQNSALGLVQLVMRDGKAPNILLT